MCVQALGLGPKDEAITTSFSFVASVNSVLLEGVTHVCRHRAELSEYRSRTGSRFFSASSVPESDTPVVNRVTGRTVKALLPVHVFGLPCDMDELMSIANEHGRCLRTRAKRRARKFVAAGLARLAVFAFYPNKQMTTGEGGIRDRRELPRSRTSAEASAIRGATPMADGCAMCDSVELRSQRHFRRLSEPTGTN